MIIKYTGLSAITFDYVPATDTKAGRYRIQMGDKTSLVSDPSSAASTADAIQIMLTKFCQLNDVQFYKDVKEWKVYTMAKGFVAIPIYKAV